MIFFKWQLHNVKSSYNFHILLDVGKTARNGERLKNV